MKSESRAVPASKYTNLDSYTIQIDPRIANFDDFGPNYRPPVIANGLKWSGGAVDIRHFYILIAYGVGNSGAPDVEIDQSLGAEFPPKSQISTILAKFVARLISRMA